jgi:hypothetical protein
MADGNNYARLFVGGIIGIFVGITVAVALFPGITSGVNSLTSGATPQVTGTPATLLGNVVLFAALGVMLFVIGWGLSFLHGKGVFAFDYASTLFYRLAKITKSISNSIARGITYLTRLHPFHYTIFHR